MPIWTIVYFPQPDQNNSPFNIILGWLPRESKRVTARLNLLAERRVADWRGLGWLKIWEGKIWQLDGFHARVMFCVDEGRIVVLHACMKSKQKTRTEDQQRVKANYSAFLKSKDNPDA